MESLEASAFRVGKDYSWFDSLSLHVCSPKLELSFGPVPAKSGIEILKNENSTSTHVRKNMKSDASKFPCLPKFPSLRTIDPVSSWKRALKPSDPKS